MTTVKMITVTIVGDEALHATLSCTSNERKFLERIMDRLEEDRKKKNKSYAPRLSYVIVSSES